MNNKTIIVKTALITSILTMILSILVFFMINKEVTSEQSQNSNMHNEKNSKQLLYTCGMHPWIISQEPGNCPVCGMKLTIKREVKTEDNDNNERKIAYWQAPMDSKEIYTSPGKSAMGMDLVPVYEDEIVGGVNVSIDPVTQQNMGVRIAKVIKKSAFYSIRTYGHITYDETLVKRINLKVSGWLEKLYVDITGQKVKKGDPLFEIYSPELLAVQEEYLAAFRNLKYTRGKGNDDMLASARRRLLYYDIASSEIATIERLGKVKKTIIIRSPFTGIVTLKNAIWGDYVKSGTTIYTIADLSKIWVEAHIYEYELNKVKTGQDANMTLPYQPGKIYKGKVAYIYPYLQKKTRDVIVRLEFDNPDMDLKPDMYADIYIKTRVASSAIMTPNEAVIHSGERYIVFVSKPFGKFIPREVTPGMSLDGGMIQILKGLAPDENIVISGQFLLDSESKLKEAVQKMMDTNLLNTKQTQESENDFFEDME